MGQVGRGSVGLIRAESCASAGAPIIRHKTAGTLHQIDFMTHLPVLGTWMHGLSQLAKFFVTKFFLGFFAHAADSVTAR